MNMVVDANIVFACIIKESITREIIFHNEIQLYAPQKLFDEIDNHLEEICTKSNTDSILILEYLEILKERITIINNYSYLEIAKKISPDPDDCLYFAISLLLECPIWSNDKELKKQNIVKIFNTKEVVELLNI